MNPNESLPMLSAFQAGDADSISAGDTPSYNAEGGLSSPPGFRRGQEGPLSSPPTPHPTFVYFARTPGRSFKIGLSRNPKARLMGLRRLAMGPLELVARVRGGRDLERFVHNRLTGHRDKSLPGREWFLPTPTVLDAVEAAKAGVFQAWIDAPPELAPGVVRGCFLCEFNRRPCHMYGHRKAAIAAGVIQ